MSRAVQTFRLATIFGRAMLKHRAFTLYRRQHHRINLHHVEIDDHYEERNEAT